MNYFNHLAFTNTFSLVFSIQLLAISTVNPLLLATYHSFVFYTVLLPIYLNFKKKLYYLNNLCQPFIHNLQLFQQFIHYVKLTINHWSTIQHIYLFKCLFIRLHLSIYVKHLSILLSIFITFSWTTINHVSSTFIQLFELSFFITSCWLWASLLAC